MVHQVLDLGQSLSQGVVGFLNRSDPLPMEEHSLPEAATNVISVACSTA